MILIYTEKITPRIEYITRLIFMQILGMEIEITSNSSEFLKSELPKINYSYEKFGDEFYIKPHRLMHCRAIITPDFNSVWYNNEKYFFESSDDSEIPFDPFAASFYIVTRHEEYTEEERDKYKRYPSNRSILSKYDLLKKPVVNIWAALVSEKLQKRFPELEFPKRKFRFVSTIDVDNAWAYSHKGFWRGCAAFSKSLLNGKIIEVRTRIKVCLGKEKDPFHTYEYIDSVFNGNEEKIRFFFLLGDYARFDKNLRYKNRHYRKLIQDTDKKYRVGIHPSFSSSKRKGKKKLGKEVERLENILGKKVEQSRQHFLRLTFPRTYRRLLKNRVTEDYTMGYSEQTGFRAGICTPYYFYDLKKEKTTNLLIVPFQVMDVTLKHYLRLSPEDAISEIEVLMQEVKNVGGTFVGIWHNETVTDLGDWKGYRIVFEKMNQLGFSWANE